MYKWLILLSVAYAACAQGEPVWTWTDENGQVHYSDRPVPGARQVELGEAQTVPRLAPARPQPAPARADRTRAAQEYRALEVARPAAQETLWNIGGQLEVELVLEPPELAPGFLLDVYLDGQRMNLSASSTRFTVPEVWRGEHTLQATLLDPQGMELLRSAPVTFFVQQASVQNPNNPNAPRRPRAP